MRDFRQFDTPAMRERVSMDVLLKRGEISFSVPGMPESKADVDGQVEVSMAALARHHERLTQ